MRELRQRASELLRLVESGGTVQITDRGRPVAVPAPLPTGPPARMRAAGETDSPATDEDFEAPLVLPAKTERPSETLRRLRSDER